MKAILFTLQWALIGLGAAALGIGGWIAAGGADHLADRWPLLADARAPGFAAAVRRAAPAVVSIRTVVHDTRADNPLAEDPVFRKFFADEAGSAHRESSLGSGVILDRTGVVLTNYHVVHGADSIRVSLHDGRSAVAKVVGTDPETDLAVLDIGLDELPAIPLGDSEALRVGDVVLAIGNPLGIGQTVTQGIVSATGRNRIGINTFENFIQTDAAINFGNSGGALVDASGALVGINAARIGTEGIGFAIPAGIAIDVARQILETGGVTRGWIGVDARDLTARLRRTLGVERGIAVLGIMKGGPADRAGIRPGDVLTEIDGRDVEDSRAAIELIAAIKPGTRIPVGGVREGRAYLTRLTVSRRPLPR